MARHFLFVLALVAAPAAGAAETTLLVPAPGSTLELKGSSNVAPWRCSGSTIEAQAEVAAPLAHINAVIDRIEDGNIGVWMANKSRGHSGAEMAGWSVTCSRPCRQKHIR